jgi:RNA polymerase sigma-70 factor (ECF subfamily)
MPSGLLGQFEKLAANHLSWRGTPPEEILVATAKSGENQAFGILFERYHRRIYSLVLRYVRIHEDAEDIVQQTFQKAYISLHRFEGRSSFSTWLTRIAINEALMLLRRNRARREVAIDESDNPEETPHSLSICDSGIGPEASYLQEEAAEILSAAMYRLTPRVRKAIEFRELRELSTRETARRMGLSVAAVKARIFHGRKNLRKIIANRRVSRDAVFNDEFASSD